MSKKLNKNLYRAILILTFVVLNGFIIFGLSSVLGYLNTGADRSSMLHLPVESHQVYLPKTVWTSIDNPGREMEKQTLAELQNDYLNSWYIKNLAYKDNNKYGVQDFYTDSAQINIYKTIDYNKSHNIHIESTTLSHNLKLEFYSTDGQLVVLTDENVEEYQQLYKNKNIAFENTQTYDYKVMMLLEDGFWRVRHIVKSTPKKEIQDTIKKNLFAKVINDKIKIDNKTFTIRGINYYPQKTPWDMFGDNFDEEIIDCDFKIISDANLNTIRIFIQYEDFGKAQVRNDKLKKLEQVLNLAKKYNIKVIVTLFDFYGNYDIQDWTLTHRHAEKIVSSFKDHPSILAWDIKNEPDLDFDSRGEVTVKKWLEYMIKEVKKFDPNHLVTIGWYSTKAAENLTDRVDFVSFHYYLKNFEEDYKELKINVPNKPLLLGEFGVSSYKGIWNPLGKSAQDQAEYHQTMQAIFKKENIAYLSWTLYDFENIPSSVVGSLPWRKNKQKHFGFMDKNGDKKPSFSFLSGSGQ